MFEIRNFKTNILLLISLLYSVAGCEIISNQNKQRSNEDYKKIRDGDIIFHKSKSSQSRLISKVTGSEYTHLGIIFYENSELFVYEAVGPVKSTAFKEWVDRGEGKHYVIKRLKDADRILTFDNLSRMRKSGLAYRGKPYDLRFKFSNDEIYCSELVYKIYKDALGIEIGDLGKFSDFNLSDPEVKRELKRRYNGEYSLTETIISPESIFRSPLLQTVEDNW
jgi:uncharacterized protein YycO